MTDEHRYVLDDREDDEMSRLGFQHRVWREHTLDVCRRAGFGKGHTLLDVGCGPGYLCRDLAEIVGSSGRVIGVDRSERFASSTAAIADNVSGVVGDAADFTIDAPAHGAIVRWVLMFLPDPGAVVASVARALAPGGMFAVMEYFDFCSISLHPEGVAFQRIYVAVHELITGAGGDPDIGARMPGLLEAGGFDIVESFPIKRQGPPGSELWQWLELINRNHTHLLEGRFITEQTLEAYHREWQDHSTRDDAFVTAPPLMVTIGRRR